MRTETRPKSLYEQAVAAENLRHASRLKELRAGEKKLALLNGITAELEAAGIALCPSDMQINQDSIFVSVGWGYLRIGKLTAWLLANGFKETARLDYPSFSSVRLSKGRLSLRFHVAVSRVAA